jgi:hypothetical protein
VLVFVDDDSDPYNSVTEWWNTGTMSYACPGIHLFEQLGLSPKTGEGTHRIGKGALIYARVSPASLTKDAKGANLTIGLAKQACALAKTEWRETNYLILRRGPYVIAAGLDETGKRSARRLTGRFVNLFDPRLEVLDQVSIKPGDRMLLVDLDKLDLSKPRVIASASKVLGVKRTKTSIRFHSEGPADTMAATRIALPSSPKSVRVGEYAESLIKSAWDPASKTLLLTYPNSADGLWVDIGL